MTEKGKNTKRIIAQSFCGGGLPLNAMTLFISPSPSIHVCRHTATKKVCKQMKYKIGLIIMHYYCFTLLYMHCILTCFINTPHFQVIYNCIDVSRHSSGCINRLVTISYGNIVSLSEQISCRPDFVNKM